MGDILYGSRFSIAEEHLWRRCLGSGEDTRFFALYFLAYGVQRESLAAFLEEHRSHAFCHASSKSVRHIFSLVHELFGISGYPKASDLSDHQWSLVLLLYDLDFS